MIQSQPQTASREAFHGLGVRGCTVDPSLTLCSPFRRGYGGQREATLREEPRLASPSPPFPPHGRKEAIAHGTGSSTQKKTPTWNGRGRHRHAAAPFPRKDVSALCRAGLLARRSYLLSAPSQVEAPQWSLQISFRLQLRGSAGFAPASLLTGSACEPLTFSV